MVRRVRTLEEKKTLAVRVGANFYIYLLLFLMYVPVLALVIFSFTGSVNFGTWSGFSFELYVTLFQDEEIMRALGNTVILALLSSFCSVVLGTLGAVGVHEWKRRSKAVAESLTQIPVVTPESVLALSLVIMFVFLGNYVYAGFGLSFWTLLIGHICLSLPFVYLSVKPKLLQMDPALYEAALDLGSTPRKALYQVTLPAILPGILSGFLLALTLSLDDFIVTSFTRGSGLLSGAQMIETISTLVQARIKKGPLPPQMRALTTLIFLFVLLVVIVVTILMTKKRKKSHRHIDRRNA